MTPILSWLIPNRVILIDMQSDTSAQEMLESDYQMVRMMDSDEVAAPVHVVMDMTQAKSMPPLSFSDRIQFSKHPKLGWGVVCGRANPVLQSIVRVGGRLIGLRMRMVHTREEALLYLKQVDPTLPPAIS